MRYFPSRRGALRPGAEYVLGVDGGSTTTKVALVDAETLEIAAAHYGRTHGDPVAAFKHCLAEVRAQIGDARPRITLAATTGSSRELLGVFLETGGVYNEIVAHAVGTTYFEPDTAGVNGGRFPRCAQCLSFSMASLWQSHRICLLDPGSETETEKPSLSVVSFGWSSVEKRGQWRG